MAGLKKSRLPARNSVLIISIFTCPIGRDVPYRKNGTFRYSECRNTPSEYSVCVQKTLNIICHTNHFTKTNNPNKIIDSYRDSIKKYYVENKSV